MGCAKSKHGEGGTKICHFRDGGASSGGPWRNLIVTEPETGFYATYSKPKGETWLKTQHMPLGTHDFKARVLGTSPTTRPSAQVDRVGSNGEACLDLACSESFKNKNQELCMFSGTSNYRPSLRLNLLGPFRNAHVETAPRYKRFSVGQGGLLPFGPVCKAALSALD